MKVTYLEKGIEINYKRYGDKVKTFYAISYFKPEKTSLVYFKTDPFNYKVVCENDIIKIEGD